MSETARVPSTRSAIRRSVSWKMFMERDSAPGGSTTRRRRSAGLYHGQPAFQSAHPGEAPGQTAVGSGELRSRRGGQQARLGVAAQPLELRVERMDGDEIVVDPEGLGV